MKELIKMDNIELIDTEWDELEISVIIDELEIN